MTSKELAIIFLLISGITFIALIGYLIYMYITGSTVSETFKNTVEETAKDGVK